MSGWVVAGVTAVAAGGVLWQLATPARPRRDRPADGVHPAWVTRVRRSLPAAWVAAGAKPRPGVRLPEVVGMGRFVPHGIEWDLSAHGWDIRTEVAPLVPGLESALNNGGGRVGVVEVRQTPGQPGVGTITVLDREPLLQPVPWAAEPGTSPMRSVTDPVRLGVGRDGRPATIHVASAGWGAHRILIGGQPGGGKSRTLHLLLWQVAALDHVRIWGVDMKGGRELGIARDRMAGVARSVDEARPLLEQLAASLAVRAGSEGDATLSTFTAADPFELLVVDELRLLAADKDCLRLLQTICEQGRAVGFGVVAALQVSTVENLPSEVRALFDVRIAHRVSDDDMAKAILGSHPPKGSGPARIPRGEVGAGWAWVEDDVDDGRMIRVAFVGSDDGRLRAHYRACAGPGPGPVDGPPAAPAKPRSRSSGTARRAARAKG